MNILWPSIKLAHLPRMLGIAILGALIAGGYGMLHDQLTYCIAPEYFTHLKFSQFEYADFGFPRRVFVAEIGFLATWWVGFFSGWFLARLAVPVWPSRVAREQCLFGFGLIFACAASAGGVGAVLGFFHSPDYSYWQEMCQSLGVTDIPGFVRVAYIHNAGYLGGLIGLIFAIVHMLWKRAHFK